MQLKPEINNSNTLGGSLTLPYFRVISDNKDLTFTPIMFDSGTSMLTTEYREVNKNSKTLADFGYANSYKSVTTNKKSNLSHLFFRIDLVFATYSSKSPAFKIL